MAYTPNAEDTAQPTGNQALSTAALEFRTLKTYIQATKTAQDARDDAQDVATALVASNLAAALVTQDTRDDGQDSGIAAATALGITGIANAAAALALARSKLTKLDITGTGTFTVPADVTSIIAIVQGGGTAEAEYSQGSQGQLNFAFYSLGQLGDVRVATVYVTPGDIIACTCGSGQSLQIITNPSTAYTAVSESTSATASNFGTVIALAAVSRYAVSQSPNGLSGAGYVTKQASTFQYADTYDGHLPTTDLSLTTAGTSVMNAGYAGRITLLY